MSSEAIESKKSARCPPINSANAREFQKRSIASRLANTERRQKENSEPALRELAKKRLLFLLAGINGPTNAMKLANAYAMLCDAERAEKKPDPKPKPEKPVETPEVAPEGFIPE